MEGMFDVHDLTNKVDVGSQPGTMWSLSSQKPGHGIAELRDDDTNMLWQSDGFLPHLINIQFAQRTAVTHVSLYTDFRLDDSYTPIKIRIMAGTHHHDLVEVRTREFVQPTGWKHFVMDKFDSVAESEESDSDSSTLSLSDELSDSASAAQGRGWPFRAGLESAGEAHSGARSSAFLASGVSRKHAPIFTYLVQVCILANHAIGKDTHVRGIKIFGPPTAQSREKARRDAKKRKESRRISGSRAVRLRKDREVKRRKRANEGLRQWVQEGEEEEAVESSGTVGESGEGQGPRRPDIADGSNIDDRQRRLEQRIPTSRTLELLSSLR